METGDGGKLRELRGYLAPIGIFSVVDVDHPGLCYWLGFIGLCYLCDFDILWVGNWCSFLLFHRCYTCIHLLVFSFFFFFFFFETLWNWSSGAGLGVGWGIFFFLALLINKGLNYGICLFSRKK
jgi:hypothetical protein